jgi:hypothetical protein
VPADAVPASRKLGRDDALALARKARTVVVARGRKVTAFEIDGTPGAEVVDAMLGPTGNLRAPTLRVGSTLLVGFDEDAYRDAILG